MFVQHVLYIFDTVHAQGSLLLYIANPIANLIPLKSILHIIDPANITHSIDLILPLKYLVD